MLILAGIGLLLCASLAIQFSNQYEADLKIDQYTSTRRDDLQFPANRLSVELLRMTIVAQRKLIDPAQSFDEVRLRFELFQSVLLTLGSGSYQTAMKGHPAYDSVMALCNSFVATFEPIFDDNPSPDQLKRAVDAANDLQPAVTAFISETNLTSSTIISGERQDLSRLQQSIHFWSIVQGLMVTAFAGIAFWMFRHVIRSRRGLIAQERRAAAAVERETAQQEMARTLELLGDIGQAITANLDLDEVFATLASYVDGMLDAPAVMFGQYDKNLQVINVFHHLKDGDYQVPFTIALDDPQSDAARCLREHREILIGTADLPADAPDDMKTFLYRPLEIGDQLLGLLAVQSRKPDAYGERELFIFRSLCAYGAIATANASAFTALGEAMEELRATQTQLVEQEKLASLGQLVAGVAHEVNTPVGIAVSAASQLDDEVKQLKALVADNKMRRADFDEFLEISGELSRLMLANCQRAAELIGTFKKVAVDRTTEDARDINLKRYVLDVLSTLHPLLNQDQVQVDVQGADDVLMLTYPGPLAQILTNIVANAANHAFGSQTDRRITIVIEHEGEDRARLSIGDNGTGMSADVARHAFEPFFTTKRNAGGTGLGLHIVHNLVTAVLAGEIVLATTLGVGTRFDLSLPLSITPVPAMAQ